MSLRYVIMIEKAESNYSAYEPDLPRVCGHGLHGCRGGDITGGAARAALTPAGRVRGLAR